MKRKKVELNWDDEDLKKKKKGLSEVLKKIGTTGLSSSLLSENQLKIYLSSLNLSKEMVTQLLKVIQKSKDDVIQKVGNEFSKIIQKIDFVKEFNKILSDHRISIRAEIEFIPKNKKEKINTNSVSKKSFPDEPEKGS